MKHLLLDSQVLTSLSHCPTRAYFGFVERLVPKEESKAFAMGSGVHVANESYYRGLKEEKTFKERYDEALLTSHNWMVTQSNLTVEDQDIVLKTLDQYYKFRKEDRILVSEVEVYFSKVLYEGKDLKDEDIQVIYQGRIDLIAESDRKEVIDHKTTSRNFEPVDLRVQYLGYAWATGLPVTENRIGFQATLKPEQKFKRFPFKFQPELVDAWERFATGEALKYAYYLEEGEFPQNFGSCEGSYGYPCKFINLCRYPSLAEETKNFEFVIGAPWDPMKEKNT